MNPFDSPPSTPPVGFDPPQLIGPRRGRGRMAIVALASAGLVAGGIVVVSQLASADKPEVVPVAAAPEPGDETVGSVPPTTQPGESSDSDSIGDGKITIDVGDGNPITLDLGNLGVDFDALAECLGLPMFDIDLDELGDLEPSQDVFDGGKITVVGPDGVSIIDFGDGDGSVTISKSGDEITISSEGDVAINELGDATLPIPSLPEMPDRQQIEDCLNAPNA